jgi:predicted enzyme related to lactoylglutathione lyase
MNEYLSQITFMYFDDLKEAKVFFEQILKLKKVFEPEWATVYRVADKAFIGAVDASRGSIESSIRGGSLISMTVDDVIPYYERLKSEASLSEISDIKRFDDIGVKSFFFKGPNGYDFEIQQFTNPEIKKMFD